MHLNDRPHKDTAWIQWDILRQVIIRLGGWTEYIRPHKDLPDMVFTANAGFVNKNQLILSKFKHPERQLEEPLFKHWFEKNGFEVAETENLFEGAGDALVWGDTIFMGYGFRTEKDTSEELEYFTGSHVAPVKLIDENFYHLDTCFCPINSEVAMVYPDAIDPADYEKMKVHGNLIEVSKKDALRFACNSVVIGQNLLIPHGCNRLLEQLKDYPWINIHLIPMNEFIKAGGACKCLTLELPAS